MITIKTAVKLSPLALPIIAGAEESGHLSNKTSIVPFSPVTLPVWAWLVVGVGGTWALFRYWK